MTVSPIPSGETLRDHFTGKEDQSPDFGLSYLDFGARHFSPGLGRWLTPDPLGEKYYDVSPYAYCHNNPLLIIDPSGKWDITVHFYSNRDEYGYGIAVVTDQNGHEVFRFTVRGQRVMGSDRMRIGGDTPLGVYDIPNKNAWISGGSRLSYGPNPRLNMVGMSGEIIQSGRSNIRIHGGRQEIKKQGKWTPRTNGELKKNLWLY